MASAAFSISLVREIDVSRSLAPLLRYVSIVADFAFPTSVGLEVNRVVHVSQWLDSLETIGYHINAWISCQRA